MPTRNSIRAATPRCPGPHVGTAKWSECDRLLKWNHNHGAWICEKHGVQTDPAPHHAGVTADNLASGAG